MPPSVGDFEAGGIWRKKGRWPFWWTRSRTFLVHRFHFLLPPPIFKANILWRIEADTRLFQSNLGHLTGENKNTWSVEFVFSIRLENFSRTSGSDPCHLDRSFLGHVCFYSRCVNIIKIFVFLGWNIRMTKVKFLYLSSWKRSYRKNTELFFFCFGNCKLFHQITMIIVYFRVKIRNKF